MRRAFSVSFAFLLSIPLYSQPADTIYVNAKVLTLDPRRPAAEAFAVRGNRFLAVGTSAEVRSAAGPATRQIDLHGRMVVPGLIDAHTHPIGAALSEQHGPVPVMHSIPEIQAYLKRMAANSPKDELLLIPKVYSTRLAERRYPTRQELDAAAPGRLAMTDNDYAAVLNSALLGKLGITRDTPQPANGKIIKDANGDLTGLLLGARELLGPYTRRHTAGPGDMEWALREMQRAYNAAGLTSTIDRGQGPEGFRLYQEFRRRNALTVRTAVTYLITARGTPEQVRREVEQIPLVTGWGDEWLRVGAIKTVVDGGILIGTAYLREPYGMNTQIYGYQDPDYRGVLNVPRENLIEMARAANRLGWQMTAHTAGGGAIDVLLDAYEAADRDRPIRERRFTVTHGNFPNQDAITRAAKLGVAYDVQPAWHHFDGPALKDVFGPARTADFLPLRRMLDAGLVVAGGSDHMIRFDSRQAINPFHPFFGMWMAVTRKTADGATLHPEQGLTRLEALRMWTLNPAWMTFEENVKGSIEPGKLADFVVISKDYLNCPADEIKDIEALLTVVDGKAVFTAATR